MNIDITNIADDLVRAFNDGYERGKAETEAYLLHCGDETPVTNGDRIRTMSDEELATWLNCMQSNAYHCGEFGRTNAAYPYDNKAWIDWLKQEASE